MNVESKLHLAIECARRGAVFAPMPNKKLRPVAEFVQASVLSMLESMLTLPHFVFSEDILRMVSNEDATRTAEDMQRAGVYKLPFTDVVVEPIIGERVIERPIVVIRDKDGAFNSLSFSYLPERATTPECVIVPHTVIRTSMRLKGAEGMEETMFQHDHRTVPWFDEIDEEAAQSDVKRTSYACGLALMCATVAFSTLGLAKETHRFERLNKRRTVVGKAPVPSYTYVRVGHLYRAASGDASDAYEPRKSPRPHWRRGHVRSVRVGTGRTGSRLVFIPPRMVALAADAVVPAPNYRVT